MKQQLKRALTALLMSVICFFSFAQKTVTGSVKDTNGEPMIGVSVLVVGTNNGTVTDLDGNYTISGVSENGALKFSYIGYAEQLISVAGENSINVVMKDDNELLDEVVVVGYGIVKKRDLTGSVVSVKSKDIVRMPTSNVMEAIQGQVPGLDIIRGNGDAGSDVSITLRGNRSFNGDNSPLFIIDGFESSYSELNPNDIASIEVLKDASSTAIYGSAGANGVIIITTKSPKTDRMPINLDAYYGVNYISSFPEVNTGDDYINFRRIALKNAGLYTDENNLFPAHIQGYIDDGKWVNWADEAAQTGITQNYNLSTTYANNHVNSFFSLGYHKTEGILKNDQLTRYSLRGKIDYMVNKYMKYGMNIYAMYSENDKRYNRIWNRVLCMPPLGDVYDEFGEPVSYPLNDGNMNPLADMGTGQYVNNIKRLSVTPQVYLELTPFENFSFKSTLGGYFANNKQSSFTGLKSYQSLESGLIQANIPQAFRYNYKWENVVNYQFNIGENHAFNVTAVAEWSKNRVEHTTATSTGFDSNYYTYHNLAAGKVYTVSSDFIGSQKMGYVARINYNYKGRYLATLSNRWDGSSILAKGNQWAMFPAGAVAWRISDEAFMEQHQDWLSNAKLRVGYGVTGNAGAAEYATLDFSRTGVLGFQDVSTPFSGFNNNIANRELEWEKSYQWNIGLDLGFFNERLQVTADWYHTDTKDVLYQKSIAYGAGGVASRPFTIWSNVGHIRNAGLELAVTGRIFTDQNRFNWTSTISFSTNSEKVIKTTSDGPLAFGDYFLIPGEAVKTYYGYKYMGIWGTAEAEEAAKYGKRPGMVRLAEKPDADGNINYRYSVDDYFVLGKATPDWFGSWGNSLSYKNIDLHINTVARFGQTIPYGITGWYRTDGISPSPVICDFWTEDNQGARFPAPNASMSQDEHQVWANYFDGSYVKIRTVSLGYTFSKNLIRKAHIENLRLYVTANNPFIYSMCSYLKNYDPEKGGDDDDSPLTKQIVFGMNIQF